MSPARRAWTAGSRLKKIWADGAYSGTELADWCEEQGEWELEIVERDKEANGFKRSWARNRERWGPANPRRCRSCARGAIGAPLRWVLAFILRRSPGQVPHGQDHGEGEAQNQHRERHRGVEVALQAAIDR
jgi:transposase